MFVESTSMSVDPSEEQITIETREAFDRTLISSQEIFNRTTYTTGETRGNVDVKYKYGKICKVNVSI